MKPGLSPLFTWRSAICESDLPAPTRHVALVLSLHMNERGGSCFPEVSTLAQETGLHRETVTRHIKRLVDDGWLRRKPRKGTSTEYAACQPSVGTHSEQVPTEDGYPQGAGTHDELVDLPIESGQGYPRRVGTRTYLGRHEDVPPAPATPAEGETIVEQLTSALLEACRLAPMSITRNERSKARNAARTLAELDPPPTSDDVLARAKAWRQKWPSQPTPMGLANNWGVLAAEHECAPKPAGPPPCPQCEGLRQVEDPEPGARGMIPCPDCRGTGRAA